MKTSISNYRRGLRRMMLGAALLASAATAWAYTVEWAIVPSYEQFGLKRTHRHGLYQQEVWKNGHLEDLLVDTTGRELFRGPAEFTFKQFGENGLSAVYYGDENHRGTLFVGLFDEREQRFVHFPKGVYMKTRYATEGCICVRDSNYRVGYIGLDGRWVIPCQFRSGEPFREGWALVEDEQGELMYVGKDWERTRKPLKLKVGRIERGSSFANGTACVTPNNGRTIIIDREGKEVKQPKEFYEFKIKKNSQVYDSWIHNENTQHHENYIRNNEIRQDSARFVIKADPYDSGIINRVATEDGELGYTYGGKPFVPIQFLNQEAEDFDGDYAVVMMNVYDVEHFPKPNGPFRCQGLLHKLDGDFEALQADSVLTAKPDGTFTAFTGRFRYPTTLNESKLFVKLCIGGQDTTTAADNYTFANGEALFTWTPTSQLMDSADKCEITYQVYADHDLLLWEQTVPVHIVKPTKQLPKRGR